jgi:hypothetical protein
LDGLFYANRAFFSPTVLEDYESFSNALFKTYARPGVDAQLRTTMTSPDGDRAKAYPETWDPGWAALFVEQDDRTSRSTIDERYDALQTRLGSEVGA